MSKYIRYFLINQFIISFIYFKGCNNWLSVMTNQINFDSLRIYKERFFFLNIYFTN